MEPQSTSLFSLLFFLLLPPPSLHYSVENCTIDFDDPGKIDCDRLNLGAIPSDVPKSVTYLNVFLNQITRISQTDLIGLTRLKTLEMAANDISHIEDGAFADLSALTKLNLLDNKLFALTDDMFKGLSSLMILNLGNNQIKSISKFAFEPLKNLQELNLWSNKLFQISDITNIVSHCPSLKTLDLQFNRLSSFESDIFSFPLLNLTELHIGSKSLRTFSVHSDVFPRLESLSFSVTGPELHWDVSDKTFLKSVRSLDLSGTELMLETYRVIFQSVELVQKLELTKMNKDLLDLACVILSLQSLSLSRNYFSSAVLNDSLLQSCTNLTELDLSQNSLTDLSESSLRMLTQLSRLNIESNTLSRVPLTIRNMSTLTNLSFESNYITELQCSDFSNLYLLSELNLNSNQISKLRSCVFKDLHSLEELHVQNNYLLQIGDNFGVGLPSLVTLNTYRNNLGQIKKGTFHNTSSLTDLNLHSVGVTLIEKGSFKGLVNLERLSFSPSDHSLHTLSHLVHLKTLVMFISGENGLSQLPNYEPMFVNLASLQKLTITVTFDAYLRWSKDTLKGLDKLRVFSADKFFSTTPHPETFLYTPLLLNLQIINCAKFNLGTELFQPIPNLQSLDLSQNHLKSLDFLSEANLTKLEKLVLVNNDLMVINETVFEALPSLKYLDLSGNPFACNCSNAGFIQWTIRNKQVYVVSAFQYRCSSPLSHEGHFLLDFNVQSCWDLTAFLCFISSSALVLLTLLSSFIYHFLRWQLVYGFYLLLAFLYDSKKRRQGCPHIYDAFVSYNVHDEDWVYGELVPELEGRQGWRLCLHHRDFEPGKPIIENITDAIYSSRKTLCVISRRYLQSEWCSQEIQMASFRLFDEQKDVLILLFLEQMSSNQLSPFYRMRKLVKSRTYLSWTQAHSHKGLFWEKVRRALESGNEPGDNHNPLTANV